MQPCDNSMQESKINNIIIITPMVDSVGYPIVFDESNGPQSKNARWLDPNDVPSEAVGLLSRQQPLM